MHTIKSVNYLLHSLINRQSIIITFTACKYHPKTSLTIAKWLCTSSNFYSRFNIIMCCSWHTLPLLVDFSVKYLPLIQELSRNNITHRNYGYTQKYLIKMPLPMNHLQNTLFHQRGLTCLHQPNVLKHTVCDKWSMGCSKKAVVNGLLHERWNLEFCSGVVAIYCCANFSQLAN